jgi:hypothetical protein
VVKSSGKDEPTNSTGTGNEQNCELFHESGSETALEITAGAVESIAINMFLSIKLRLAF